MIRQIPVAFYFVQWYNFSMLIASAAARCFTASSSYMVSRNGGAEDEYQMMEVALDGASDAFIEEMMAAVYTQDHLR